MPSLRRLAGLSPTKIAGGYALFGGLWILLSDALVNHLVQEATLLSRIQTVKGWMFVLLSSLLILGLVQTRERQLQSSRDRLSRATEELHVLHRIYRHNIRNDLNVVRGYIETCKEELERTSIKRQLDYAYSSTNRILGVSEKLRMIEEANTAAANTDTVDVTEVLGHEVDRLRDEHPDLDVVVEAPPQAWVYGDHSLGYVVRELLQNAVEHHDQPLDRARLEIEITRSVSTVEVVIADDGPGIHPSEIEALEHGTESPLLHTSGIGLWLVKWLCLFFDGQVTFERRAERGTAVTLTFESAFNIDQVVEQALGELPGQAAA